MLLVCNKHKQNVRSLWIHFWGNEYESSAKKKAGQLNSLPNESICRQIMLERGVKIPKLETFIRIVEVLDVSADVLIRDSVPSASHVVDDELNRKLSQLTPGQKKAAIDILNAYTDNIPYITK